MGCGVSNLFYTANQSSHPCADTHDTGNTNMEYFRVISMLSTVRLYQTNLLRQSTEDLILTSTRIDGRRTGVPTSRFFYIYQQKSNQLRAVPACDWTPDFTRSRSSYWQSPRVFWGRVYGLSSRLGFVLTQCLQCFVTGDWRTTSLVATLK